MKPLKYVTDSKVQVVTKRLESKHYEAAQAVIDKFEVVVKRDIDLCGNVRVEFTNSKAKLVDMGTLKDSKTPDYKQISSALALYRTVALFKCGLNAEDVDFYKMNWSIRLKCKDTGKCLGLGEWKGGFQIFTEAGALKQLPKQFVKNAEALLTLLASNKCPIGYDGVVAGSVA